MTPDLASHPWRGPLGTILLLSAVLGGCATGSPTSPVVARSSLGPVTADDLERFIAHDPRWRDGTADRADHSWRRARLEELIALQALADEARRDRLLADGPAADEWRRRRRSILVEEVERRAGFAAPMVTDDDVQAYLTAHPEELWRDERLRLRHIFRHLPTRSTATDRARAREEMEALVAELRDGADFKTLARERSDSQTAGFDGLIAPVGLGDLEPAVEDVVWALEVGEVSEVVETPAGYHLFRLEERIPGAAIPPEEVDARVRARLGLEARQTAADRTFVSLLEASRAIYRPDELARRAPDPAAVLFELDGDRLTARDLRERWGSLSFVARRTTALEELLWTEAWQRLALWEADRQHLAADPAVAARLASAEEEALVSAASARWVREVEQRVGDDEIADLVAANEGAFRRPASWRLRMVIRHLEPGQAPLEVYDHLDAVAARVRSTELDLAEAARRWSSDPSGDAGGDLGWVDTRALAVWAGPRFAAAVSDLAAGELGGPFLVELYEPGRLAYRADAYALVRVEESRPEGLPPLEEIRRAALDRLLAGRAPEIRAELRKRILERVGASVDDAALTATSPRDR